MANMLFANNCNTTLNGGITAVATSMVVTSATGFPVPTGSQYFYCTLADAATQTTIEIVKVTAVSGTTFTIVRGQDGTTGTIFASGAVVSLRLVRANLNDFPKLDEANTFTADQSITGQLTTSAGLATTNTFTATPPADGLVMDYATGFGRFSAFAGDGFQWYNAGVANTKLMQLSSTGVITIATWNGATVGTGYGGTGLTSFTANGLVFASSTSALATSSNLTWTGTNFNVSGGLLRTVAAGADGYIDCTTTGVQNTVMGFNNTGSTNIYGVPNNYSYFGSLNGYGLAFLTNGATQVAQYIFPSGGMSLGNTTDSGAGSLNVNKNILIGTSVAPFQTTNGQLALGSALGIQTSGDIAAGGTLDLTINTSTYAGNAGAWAGILSVCTTRGNYAPQATHTVYALVGYGTTFTATPLVTQNGSGGASLFTITSPSAGVIRLTDISASGSDIFVYMHFSGTKGLT